MVYAVLFFLSVFVAGMVLLFLLGRNTWRAFTRMIDTVGETGEQIAAAAAELERVAPNMSETHRSPESRGVD